MPNDVIRLNDLRLLYLCTALQALLRALVPRGLHLVHLLFKQDGRLLSPFLCAEQPHEGGTLPRPTHPQWQFSFVSSTAEPVSPKQWTASTVPPLHCPPLLPYGQTFNNPEVWTDQSHTAKDNPKYKLTLSPYWWHLFPWPALKGSCRDKEPSPDGIQHQ